MNKNSSRYVMQSEHPLGTRRVYWVEDTQRKHRDNKQVTADTYNRSTAERWCAKLNAENAR